MNAKKAKALRRLFPKWNVKEYQGKQVRKVIPNLLFWKSGSTEVIRTTIFLKPSSDASVYRAVKRATV